MPNTNRVIGIVATVLASFVCQAGRSVEAQVGTTPTQEAKRLSADMSAFLAANCRECHAGDEAEAGLDLTIASIELTQAEVRRRWTYLHDRVASGEMPPKDADQPSSAMRREFLTSLAGLLTRADLAQREVILRRLNRNEYTNTVRDLFGVYVDVSRVLLDDSTESGFDNIGSDLTISSEQMQTYVEAADLVLDEVFGPDREPMSTNKTVNLLTLPRVLGTSERKLEDGAVLFSGSKTVALYGLSVRSPGLYRFKIKARAEQSQSPVVLHVKGGLTGTIAPHTVGFFDVLPGKTQTIEFTDRAPERSDCLGFTVSGGYPYYSVNHATYKGPGIFIGDITIEGPVDEWSASRKRLLGNVNASTGTLADVRSILQNVATRAFRRPITSDDVAPYVELARRALDGGKTFEKALRLGLKGVLCAPEFLYLEETLQPPKTKQTAEVSDYSLATRLSYFLWSSLPDAELTAVAERGELKRPDVLRKQVDRMLADPKSNRFVESFTGQWLRVRDIDFTVPDGRLYPEYNELLREAMIGETRSFFREILDNDLSVQNFIDSDFLMLNQPIAKFYGIEGVNGLAFRRVARPSGSVRGGVLTQASVLKVSADGTRTSPVLRGVWILNHMFGTPAPPPPASVDIVQPDIRGAETIREQLAKHRADPSCARCHSKIDPPGFALESFDVLGAERSWYRVRQGRYFQKQLHPFAPTNVQYRKGPDVDATGAMPDGRKFANIREYKQLLLADQTAMPRALTRLILSYSLGREIGFSDRAEIDRIVATTKSKQYGLRSIIHEVVQSPTFRAP